MDKKEFITALKEMKIHLQSLKKKCEDAPGKQVQSKVLLQELEEFATSWFEQIEPHLRAIYHLSDDTLSRQRELFGTILEFSGGKPYKQKVLGVLTSLLDTFHADLLVPVQKHNEIISKYPSLDAILSHSVGLELDYLNESVECAKIGKFRAAIILGWCAAVSRLHLYIQKEGFPKFNQASVQMSAIQAGRYKRFNKRFDVQNLADLRMSVFDNDLLWVLEFLTAIDGNQHERLEICFTMRNTCAHPGEATVSPENVLSYFSDLDKLVFDNPKFSLK
jgi:hypothetical protein